MLRYVPLIGLFPTFAWWFVAWDLTAPWSDTVARAFWLYATICAFGLGLAIRRFARA